MDHIYRQRELLKVIGLVKPGNVLKMHHIGLGFGNESKPFHFSVNTTHAGTTLETVFLVPVSSKLYHERHAVSLNLSKDSNLQKNENEILDRKSYALISKTRQVKVEKLFEPPGANFRGSLTVSKRNEILEVRKMFLKQQFANKKRGNTK